MITIEYHPAANLLPMLQPDELEGLSKDIKENGQREAIVLLNGKILDGRNRWLACEKAGVKPKTKEWDGEGGSPTAWVISVNYHRRHLSASQKAAVALQALPMLEDEARVRNDDNRRANSVFGVLGDPRVGNISTPGGSEPEPTPITESEITEASLDALVEASSTPTEAQDEPALETFAPTTSTSTAPLLMSTKEHEAFERAKREVQQRKRMIEDQTAARNELVRRAKEKAEREEKVKIASRAREQAASRTNSFSSAAVAFCRKEASDLGSGALMMPNAS